MKTSRMRIASRRMPHCRCAGYCGTISPRSASALRMSSPNHSAKCVSPRSSASAFVPEAMVMNCSMKPRSSSLTPISSSVDDCASMVLNACSACAYSFEKYANISRASSERWSSVMAVTSGAGSGPTVILIGAAAPFPASPSMSGTGLSRTADCTFRAKRGKVGRGTHRRLRICHPSGRTLWLSIPSRPVRFGQDAYSDAVHIRTDYKACAVPKPACPERSGEEGAMEEIVWVGVDWADREHAYAVRAVDGKEYKGKFCGDPESVHEWVRKLRERHSGATIIVGLEQSRGALMYALCGYEFLRLVPINPRAAQAYRQSLILSGAKDDPVDAGLIRDFVANHVDRLRVWRPDDEPTKRLRLLVEGRRKFVDQRTSFTQALSATLKQYFPQILEWFHDANAPLTLAF